MSSSATSSPLPPAATNPVITPRPPKSPTKASPGNSSSSGSPGGTFKTTATMHQDFCRALGCCPETGKCLRHPTVVVCNFEQPQLIVTCRICESEMEFGNIYRQRRSMAPNIEQIKLLHTDFQGYKDWEWGALDDTTPATTTTTTTDAASQKSGEKQDDEDDAGDEDIDDEDDGDQPQNQSQQQPLQFSHATVWRYIQQAVWRTWHVQQWSESIKPSSELEQLRQQVEQLKASIEAKDGQIANLQTTVDRQQKTITQELRMIKTIAKKRASERRRGSGTSSGSSEQDVLRHQQELSESSLGVASVEAPPKLPGRKASEPRQEQMQQQTQRERHGSDDFSALTTEESTTRDMSVASTLPRLPPGNTTVTAVAAPKLPIRQASSYDHDIAGTPSSSSRPTAGPRRQVSFNSPENAAPPTLPQRLSSGAVASRDTSPSSSSSRVGDAAVAAPAQAGPPPPPPPPPEGDESDDSNHGRGEDTSWDTGKAKILASSVYSSMASGQPSTMDYSTTMGYSEASQSLVTTSTWQQDSVSASPRVLSMHRIQSHDGAATYSTYDRMGSQYTMDTDTDQVVVRSGVPQQQPPPQQQLQRKLSSRPTDIDEDYSDAPLQRHLSLVSTDISLQPEDLCSSSPPEPQQQQQPEYQRPRSHSQEIAFFPTVYEQEQTASVPPPPPTTPGSVPAGLRKSQPATFDGHATAPVGFRKQQMEEIQFDASAVWGRPDRTLPEEQQQKEHVLVGRKTSVAHVKFNASEQLILEASKALGTMPTPSSVKLRKSLIKSIKKAAGQATNMSSSPKKTVVKSPKQQSGGRKSHANDTSEIVLSPKDTSARNLWRSEIQLSSPPMDGNSNNSARKMPGRSSEIVVSPSHSSSARKLRSSFQGPAPPPTSTTKEIEFTVPQVETQPKPKRTLLEQHLEGPSRRHLGESMHNKTEEQILQERVYGKAAMATAEDEENSAYDNFDAEELGHLPFTNKGYLEYNRSLNLSPVSCLTTGSYLRDGGHGDDGEEDGEEIGPRKAIHNAGFAKRLPLEDGFDSGEEDDTAVPQPDDGVGDDDSEEQNDNSGHQQHDEDNDDDDDDEEYEEELADEEEEEEELKHPPEKEPPPKLTNLSPKPSSRHSTSKHESSQSSDLHLSNSSLNHGSTQSFQSLNASGQSFDIMAPVATRPNNNNKSSSSKSSRSSKPVIRVDGATVQDKYGDGGIYTGTISKDDHLPHGFGQMKYDNERQYAGEWKSGRWHGHGRWVNPNGDCYEGTFVYDARHGTGVYTWKNGNVYRGEFHEDKRQGKGTFNFANGNLYEGEFANGVFEGEGRYKFDGGFYEGHWKNGRYHGNGLLLFSDGSSYQGEFLDGVAHGKGVEKGADGTVRRGIWENGRPQAVQ